MEKDIIEGNKLIAEFCGMDCVLDEDCLPDYPEYHWEIMGKEYNLFYKMSGLHWPFKDPPNFHSNWSWLMPVVEKINWMNGAQGYSFVIYRASVQVNDSMDVMFEVCADKKRTLLMCVWQSVIQFITWYNSNPQLNPTTHE